MCGVQMCGVQAPANPWHCFPFILHPIFMTINTAFVLLNRDACHNLNPEEVAQALRELWPDAPALAAAEATTGGERGAASFHLGDAVVAIEEVAAPYPAEDLAGPIASSRLWKNAEGQVPLHRRHLMVAITHEETEAAPTDAVKGATLLSRVLAAVLCTQPDATGVYGCVGPLVVPRDLLVEFVTKISPAPLTPLWVDRQVLPAESGDPNRSRGFTQGLAELGHRELVAEDAAESMLDLAQRLDGLASYVLEHGTVIQDGDTVGEDERAVLRVKFGPSPFGHDDEVMQLRYEEAPSGDGASTAPKAAAGASEQAGLPVAMIRKGLAIALMLVGIILMSGTASGAETGDFSISNVLWRAAILLAGLIWLLVELKLAPLSRPDDVLEDDQTGTLDRGRQSREDLSIEQPTPSDRCVEKVPGSRGLKAADLIGEWTASAAGENGAFMPRSLLASADYAMKFGFTPTRYHQWFCGTTIEEGTWTLRQGDTQSELIQRPDDGDPPQIVGLVRFLGDDLELIRSVQPDDRPEGFRYRRGEDRQFVRLRRSEQPQDLPES